MYVYMQSNRKSKPGSALLAAAENKASSAHFSLILEKSNLNIK
jgi:hypothetical protein